MHTGTQSIIGGRYAESSAEGLTENLKKLGFISEDLKQEHHLGLIRIVLIFLKLKNNQVILIHSHFHFKI